MPRSILVKVILIESTLVQRRAGDAMLIRIIVVIHHVCGPCHSILRWYLLVLDVIETTILLLLH